MKRFVLLIAVAVVFTACPKHASGPVSSANQEGFKAFPTARDFDPPGTIFRVDPDGQVIWVDELKVDIVTGNEVLYKLKSHNKFSLEEVLQTIGAVATALPVAASADLTVKHDFETTTKSTMGKREKVSDAALDKALGQASVAIKFKDNSQYYLIRETISTDSLSFTSSKSWLTSLGIDAEFQNVVKSKAKLEWGSGKEFSLDAKFKKQMRVWYKAERLSVERGLGMGPGQPPTVSSTGLMAPELIVPVTAVIEKDNP